MKVAVIGATGMVGSRVTSEAVRRGHDVTAVSRNVPAHIHVAQVRWVAADANDRDSLGPLLSAADAAVLTIRAAAGSESTLASTTAGVLAAASTAGTRLLIVGGAGPLHSPNRPGVLAIDDPDYVPPGWRALATASVDQLRACRQQVAAEWTYLSPPAVLMPGERTGSYRRGTDTLLVDERGRSQISAEDLAVAVLDELEAPSGLRHLTVAH